MIVFHLKRKYFEQIKSGIKTNEYRSLNGKYKFLEEFVDSNFNNSELAPVIRFDLGYAKITQHDRQLFARMKTCTISCTNNIGLSLEELKDVGLDFDQDVYNVEFELIKERN